MKIKLYYLILSIAIFALSSCGSARITEKDIATNNVNSERLGLNDSLADLLMKKGGLEIKAVGDDVRVRIRGNNSIQLDTGPLYVVNGIQMGRDYKIVNNAVAVNDIHSIRIKKGLSETTRYGNEGRNGVIEIRTKGDATRGK